MSGACAAVWLVCAHTAGSRQLVLGFVGVLFVPREIRGLLGATNSLVWLMIAALFNSSSQPTVTCRLSASLFQNMTNWGYNSLRGTTIPMYGASGGNQYSVNSCLLSYSSNWTMRNTSECSPPQRFSMQQQSNAMFVYVPSLVSDQTWMISGRLAAYPKGFVDMSQSMWMGLFGMRKSVCGAPGVSGVHHLFVTNDPWPRNIPSVWNPNTLNTLWDDNSILVRASYSLLMVCAVLLA